jgi:hypothetical protein
MVAPLVGAAALVAARLIAKKAAQEAAKKAAAKAVAKKAAAKVRTGSGISGSSGKYIHPVYKNMHPTARKSADKVVANTIVVNKGKPADIIKSLKAARKEIASLSRIRGSRTTNNQDKRRIYRGSIG